ncbi:MAG: ABC transporter ATP-binding protein [Clostridia bacterium]|nr:ABC transporter ATP-binding protein [Clostridia bacterium]
MSLIIENVGKRFITKHKKTHTLENVNLEIKPGEFVCLLGPSGCGKSTLLNTIAGLEKCTEGRITLGGKEIKGAGPDRAVMFQESALFPWLRVIDNVEFGMKIAGVPKEIRREKALKYLKMVHLTKFQNSFIHELSGGMKQRVALARALTLDSEVLLMDEPFAALDSQTKNILQLEVQQIWWETKKTIVFVTHNVEEAVLLADRVIVMSANPGRIKKEFKIQLARPRVLENIDLAYVISDVMKALKEEVEKVAKAEYDNDWNIEKDTVLSNIDSDLGVGL